MENIPFETQIHLKTNQMLGSKFLEMSVFYEPRSTDKTKVPLRHSHKHLTRISTGFN